MKKNRKCLTSSKSYALLPNYWPSRNPVVVEWEKLAYKNNVYKKENVTWEHSVQLCK
jgi:hypothetical protein